MGGMGSSFECWDSGFTVRRVEVWEVSEMKAGLMLYIVDYIFVIIYYVGYCMSNGC